MNWTSFTERSMATDRSKRSFISAAAGSCRSTEGRRALTCRAISTVFVPGWRRTATVMLRWSRPSVTNHDASFSVSTPSRTFATSPSRMGAPSRKATVTCRNCAASRSPPVASTV